MEKSKKRAAKRKAKRTKEIADIKENEEPFRKECPECGSTNVIYSKMNDNTVCQDCGAIFAKLIPEEEKKFERVREQK